MNRLIQSLNQTKYTKLVWALAISETLHNLEEAIWLPAWSKTAGIWHPQVESIEFYFVVTLLTTIFYGIIYYFSKHENKFSKYLIGGLLVIILFNVFIPHLIAAILTKHYVPGLASGVLLNVPVTFYLLQRGLNEGLYKTKTLIVSGIGFVIIGLPLLQLFFALGRVIDRII